MTMPGTVVSNPSGKSVCSACDIMISCGIVKNIGLKAVSASVLIIQINLKYVIIDLPSG